MLARCEEERRAQIIINRRRIANQTAEEDRKKSEPIPEHFSAGKRSPATTEAVQGENRTPMNADTSGQSAVAQVAATSTSVTGCGAAHLAQQRQTSAAYQMMSSNMLIPTPIAPGAGATSKANEPLHLSAANGIDLKDFENEQDPFENLSLKVMNDWEELNKVLQATSRSEEVSPATEASDSQSLATRPDEVPITAHPVDVTTVANDRGTAMLQYTGYAQVGGLDTTNLTWLACQPGHPATVSGDSAVAPSLPTSIVHPVPQFLMHNGSQNPTSRIPAGRIPISDQVRFLANGTITFAGASDVTNTATTSPSHQYGHDRANVPCKMNIARENVQYNAASVAPLRSAKSTSDLTHCRESIGDGGASSMLPSRHTPPLPYTGATKPFTDQVNLAEMYSYSLFNHLTATIRGSGYKLFVKWRRYRGPARTLPAKWRRYPAARLECYV